MRCEREDSPEDAVEQIAYQNTARDSGRHEIEKSCTWKISLVAAGNHLAGKENIVYILLVASL